MVPRTRRNVTLHLYGLPCKNYNSGPRIIRDASEVGILNVEIKCQLDVTNDIYCRFYCLLNMFRAPLCPSPGAREYYTVGRCLWYLVLWCSSCMYGVELRVMCEVCSLQTGHITLSSTPYRQLENQSTKYHRQRPSV